MHSAWLIDRRVAGGDGAGIAVGGCFANLIALQDGDPSAALGEKISTTNPNYAAADNDGVPID